MADNRENSRPGWKEFRPSKTLWFWSSVGVVVATMIVGFGWGGWVTGGTAQQKAEEAADMARAELVAAICVQRYVSGEGFADRLAELKEASSWEQEDLIEEGKWTQLPGLEEPVADAADLCAEELANMNVPNNPASDSAKGGVDTTS